MRRKKALQNLVGTTSLLPYAAEHYCHKSGLLEAHKALTLGPFSMFFHYFSMFFNVFHAGHAIITICNGTTVILEDPHTTAADDYLRLNKSKERRYHFDQALEETAQNLQAVDSVDSVNCLFFKVYERTTRFLIPSVTCQTCCQTCCPAKLSAALR